MLARMIIGLGLTVVAFAVAGRRVWWLKRLAFSGQPAPERVALRQVPPGPGGGTQLTEVIGQRKLLKWTVPGAAHAATFWGFIVLLLTIIEAYGDLFSRTFAIPGIGHWAVHRVHRGPVRRRRAGRHHHLHRHPAAQQPAQGRPPVAVLRLAHPGRLGGARR